MAQASIQVTRTHVDFRKDETSTNPSVSLTLQSAATDPVDAADSVLLQLPTVLPGTTQYVTVTSTGVMSYGDGTAVGGGGGASPWTTFGNGIYYDNPANKTIVVGSDAQISTGNALEVTGNAKFTNDVVCNEIITMSDERLKNKIQTIPQPLHKLAHLRGVSFVWKKTGKPSYGCVAQDVVSVLPDAVNTTTPEMSVNYNAIIALLVEVTKTQQAAIQTLQLEVKQLQQQLTT